MGDVQESIAVGRAQKNPRKPNWLTTNMTWPMFFQSSMRQSRLHIEKLKSVQSPRCEGCHDGQDEFYTQERHLGTVRVAQGKKGDQLLVGIKCKETGISRW